MICSCFYCLFLSFVDFAHFWFKLVQTRVHAELESPEGGLGAIVVLGQELLALGQRLHRERLQRLVGGLEGGAQLGVRRQSGRQRLAVELGAVGVGPLRDDGQQGGVQRRGERLGALLFGLLRQRGQSPGHVAGGENKRIAQLPLVFHLMADHSIHECLRFRRAKTERWLFSFFHSLILSTNLSNNLFTILFTILSNSLSILPLILS